MKLIKNRYRRYLTRPKADEFLLEHGFDALNTIALSVLGYPYVMVNSREEIEVIRNRLSGSR